MGNDNEIEVLKPQNLTNSSREVKPSDLPKYWNKEYIVEKIEPIKNYKHKMLMRFLWMTGLRVTEAVNLRKSDIDFQNYIMTVRWQKSRKFNYRNVPIHPNLKDILQLYTASMKADELVFPITRQRAWQIVKKYLGGHPHKFRHSFAVNWLRCDGDITILSRIMGHSKLQSTMIYLNIVPVDQGKELMKIEFS